VKAGVILIGAGALALSGCATARMHTESELNSIASECGLALGQLAQDEEEKRLLFIMEARPSVAKQKCVRQWARRNHLKPVIIGDVKWVTE
jgi:hypothetical protein